MNVLPHIIAAGTEGVVMRFAAAFFLVVVGAAFVYMLVRAGRAFQSVDKLVTDLDAEIMPVINKAGTTVDEVNAELDKVNDITASVAEMTERVDSATRAVETAFAMPAKKAAAFTSGVSQTVSSFFNRRGSSWNEPAGPEGGPADAGPSSAGQSGWRATGESSWAATPSTEPSAAAGEWPGFTEPAAGGVAEGATTAAEGATTVVDQAGAAVAESGAAISGAASGATRAAADPAEDQPS